jgi:hypothetical protein
MNPEQEVSPTEQANAALLLEQNIDKRVADALVRLLRGNQLSDLHMVLGWAVLDNMRYQPAFNTMVRDIIKNQL